MPSTTDGQGRLALVALEPGFYDLFHGKGTSVRNVLARYEKEAFLTSVTLGINTTVEIEATLDFHLQKTDARLMVPDAVQ